jgi:hypothetical protein
MPTMHVIPTNTQCACAGQYYVPNQHTPYKVWMRKGIEIEIFSFMEGSIHLQISPAANFHTSHRTSEVVSYKKRKAPPAPMLMQNVCQNTNPRMVPWLPKIPISLRLKHLLQKKNNKSNFYTVLLLLDLGMVRYRNDRWLGIEVSSTGIYELSLSIASECFALTMSLISTLVGRSRPS